MFQVYVISMVTVFINHGASLYINILGGAKVWVVSSSVDEGGEAVGRAEGGLDMRSVRGVSPSLIIMIVQNLTLVSTVENYKGL